MMAFVAAHRDVDGSEPIRRLLPFAPPAYGRHTGRRSDPQRWSARARGDAARRALIHAVWQENFGV